MQLQISNAQLVRAGDTFGATLRCPPCNQDEAVRRSANAKLAAEVAGLVRRLEERRSRSAAGSVDMRRRIYAAQLWVDHLELLNETLTSLGYSFEQLRALGDGAVRGLLDAVPTMAVEAEMVSRLESKTGPVSSNDVFDIQSFSSVVPYVDRVVAEKASISRALQAKLDQKYGVKLSRNLEDLLGVYGDYPVPLGALPSE